MPAYLKPKSVPFSEQIKIECQNLAQSMRGIQLKALQDLDADNHPIFASTHLQQAMLIEALTQEVGFNDGLSNLHFRSV